MKKAILFIISGILLFGCNNNKKELEALQSSYDSLLSIGFTKDTAIFSYIESFNQIQANLDSIKRAELLISQSTEGNGELEVSKQEQINRDLNTIYDMLRKNKQTIAELRANLKRTGGKASELEKMVERLAQQVEDKDAQIGQLTQQLEDMNIQIEILNTDVTTLKAEGESKSQTIQEQTTALNKAWFVVGTKRELLDQNVITREGGFAGIGANKKLKDNFNRDYFTAIDITTLRSIPLTKKKATIVTSHPSGSYKIYGTSKASDSLVITNPREFWSVSKYLVVLVD